VSLYVNFHLHVSWESTFHIGESFWGDLLPGNWKRNANTAQKTSTRLQQFVSRWSFQGVAGLLTTLVMCTVIGDACFFPAALIQRRLAG